MKKRIPQELLDTIEFLFHAKARDNGGTFTEEEREIFRKQLIQGYKMGCLNLECQQIGMATLTQITKVMRRHKNFHSFNFYGNNICDHGIPTVLQLLLANKEITVLDIGCNDLTQQSQQVLFNIIKQTNLKSLQLGERADKWHANKFSVNFLSDLIEVIKEKSQIVCLGLNGLKLSTRKGSKRQSIADKLAEYVSLDDKLRTLCISNCGFTTADMVVVTTMGLLQNKYIRFLDLAECPFDDLTGAQFTQNLYMMKNLRYLNISHCGLDKQAGIALADSFRNGSSIILLDISHNNLGDEGMNELLSVLVNNRTLTEARFRDTGFGSDCAQNLEALIQYNPVICYLDISKNPIGDEGALCISPSLPLNESLTYINLSSCHITDKGALSICTSMVYNRNITTFMLNDNFITRDCGYDLLDQLRLNEFILTLDISASQVDHFIISATEDLCQRNRQIRKDQKHLPLRQQLITLSIQRTKMPEAESRLSHLQNKYSDIMEKISITNETLDKTELDYQNQIDQLNKSINNTKDLILDEKKTMYNAKSDHEKALLNFELQYKDTVTKTERLAAENVQLEEKSARIDQNTKEQEEKNNKEIEELKKQIAELKRMTKEAESIIGDEEKIEQYEIPEEFLKEDEDTVFLVDQLERDAALEKKSTKSTKSTKSSKSKKSKSSKESKSKKQKK